MSLLRRIGRPVPPIDIMVLQDASRLNAWWQNISRTHGRFDLYGLLLVLPSDAAIISYLRQKGSELNQISGEKCLIMAMTDLTSSDDLGEFDASQWAEAVDDYVDKGYSLKANKLFELDFTGFPCLILFRDLQAHEFLTIRLKDLTVDEITDLLRRVFSIVDKADDPLDAVAEFQKKEKIKKAGRAVIGEIKALTDFTFAAVIQSLIEVSVT